jgi:hypothetical protein
LATSGDFMLAIDRTAWSRGTTAVAGVRSGPPAGLDASLFANMSDFLPGPTVRQATVANSACTAHRFHDLLLGSGLLALGLVGLVGTGWATRSRLTPPPSAQRPPPGSWWDGLKWNPPVL